MSGPSQARPAALSDFDDAADMEKPGIIGEARTIRAAVIQQPNPPSSSRGRSSTFAGEADLAIRSRTPAVATIAKPIRSTSRSQAPPVVAQPPLRRSSSSARRESLGCNDPACSDPQCQSTRNRDRRYILPQRPAAVPLQPQAPAQTQPSFKSHPSVPGARPRAQSNSNAARPQSWAGVPAPYYQYQAPYTAVAPPPARGPPPSPSSYHNLHPAVHYPTYPTPIPYPAAPNYAHSTSFMSTFQHVPEAQPYSTYYSAAPAPKVQSPVNELYNPRLSLQSSQFPPSVREPPRLTRSGSINARMPAPAMPGSWITDEEYALSDSDGSEYDEYRVSERPRRPSFEMMPPPGRPVQRVMMPSARIPEHRYSGSHSRSHSYVDPDRTSQQSTVRRQSSNASSRSRHYSVSTGASSYRTPATTISTGSRGEYLTIEDKFGRYPVSAEDYMRLQRLKEQKLAKAQQTADAESYQNAVRGGAANEITVDNIRRLIAPAPIARSRTSSHRSAQSGTQSEGIKISYGETTMHVTGGAVVELRNDAEGGAHFVINPSVGGREKSYYSETKSSGSRVGRSRGSDRSAGHRRRSTLETVAD